MTKNRILIAEDDERLAQLVSEYLSCNGFDVMVESDGSKVERCIERIKPHLLVLDLMLPGKDGLDICRDIRSHFKSPILMLTARNADIDQVTGLEYGADDYVIKPVEPRVLLARIKALLRRYDTVDADIDKTDVLNYGQLQINLRGRTVTLSGRVVDLSSHEFDLLAILVKQPGEILSRENLFSMIYSRVYDGLDRTIDVRISQLRKKLGDSADKPYRIKTIWGRGYLFVPDAWS